MDLEPIAAALERVRDIFRRRPEAALDDDAPATACWQGGLRMVASHANGTQIATDMPAALGGRGERVTPAWLFRAGLASCAASSIVMAAASSGIALQRLEVRVGSRSDARGMLGMPGDDGRTARAAPHDLRLEIRLAADGVPPERLHEVVEEAISCSPIPCAVRAALPLAIDVQAHAYQSAPQ